MHSLLTPGPVRRLLWSTRELRWVWHPERSHYLAWWRPFWSLVNINVQRDLPSSAFVFLKIRPMVYSTALLGIWIAQNVAILGIEVIVYLCIFVNNARFSKGRIRCTRWSHNSPDTTKNSPLLRNTILKQWTARELSVLLKRCGWPSYEQVWYSAFPVKPSYYYGVSQTEIGGLTDLFSETGAAYA